MTLITEEREVTSKLKEELKSFQLTSSSKTTKLENKYLAEMRKITSKFEAYKKETQQSMQSLTDERMSLDSQKQIQDAMINRLKQEKRALVQNNESSVKMHREKIEKLQAELTVKCEEVKKFKSRITTLKNSVGRLENLTKKPIKIVLTEQSVLSQEKATINNSHS